MARKSTFDGIIVKRDADDEGCVDAYDWNDRLCWDRDDAERVVLTEDLRRYAPGLHIGQLGWTVPGTTDGHKWVDVLFDNGVRLPILTLGLQRVVPEQAGAIAGALLASNRDTRVDADPEVAARRHKEWVKQEYEPYVDTDEMVELGCGAEELYAFTFRTLRELTALRGKATYPVKVGYTAEKDVGAISRVRQLIVEPAAYPERPLLLVVCRTADGRALETAVHRRLRADGRGVRGAVGREWFETTAEEVILLCREVGGLGGEAPDGLRDEQPGCPLPDSL